MKILRGLLIAALLGLNCYLNDKGFTIDNFATGGASSVGSVPEPGTLALLGLGLTRLAWLRPLLHCDLSMAATIEFRNVSYQIAGRPILRNVTFSVDSAETLVLLGRSGSGKTTALRMVNALAYPTEGEVLVEGKPTTAWDPVALRRGIGYVIQEGGLFPHWSVAANVGLAPRLQNWPAQKREERVRELLIMIGLPLADYGDRRPRQLSGGQKQRVGVARALAADPPILLFDEPFGALDPITRLELQRMFLSLRNQLSKAALFVTHDVAEALMLGTRIALLNAGTLAWIGPSKTFRDASLEEARAFLACLGER